MDIDQIRRSVESKIPEVKYFPSVVGRATDNPETATCDKHGEFEFKYIRMWDGKIAVCGACEKCISERKIAVEAEINKIVADLEAEIINNKIIECGVSKRNIDKSFDSYICELPEQTKSKAYYRDFADAACAGNKTGNLIVCGSTGTGKTHLASCVIINLVKSGKRCAIKKIIDIIRTYKNSWIKNVDYTETDVIDYFSNLDVLIIDEVGMQFGSDTEKMIIFDIIDGRYNNMLPTILISNLELSEVKELIGDRSIDRLREDGGVVVAMKWASNRGK
jgi:DNA replication protein DnaC